MLLRQIQALNDLENTRGEEVRAMRLEATETRNMILEARERYDQQLSAQGTQLTTVQEQTAIHDQLIDGLTTLVITASANTDHTNQAVRDTQEAVQVLDQWRQTTHQTVQALDQRSQTTLQTVRDLEDRFQSHLKSLKKSAKKNPTATPEEDSDEKKPAATIATTTPMIVATARVGQHDTTGLHHASSLQPFATPVVDNVTTTPTAMQDEPSVNLNRQLTYATMPGVENEAVTTTTTTMQDNPGNNLHSGGAAGRVRPPGPPRIQDGILPSRSQASIHNDIAAYTDFSATYYEDSRSNRQRRD
jgi:hypothetical protein